MPLRLTTAHCSETGLRDHNEDFVGILTPDEPALTARGVIAAIADGVSGSLDGREAAEYSVRELLKAYYATPDSWPVMQSLDKVIQEINRWTHQQGGMRAQRGGMATTLTALVLRGNSYYFAHVGDTRLYRLRDGELRQLTIDHVRDHDERRHVLTRAIGMDSQLAVDHGMGETQAGDIFLLATDGVWGAMPEYDLSWHLSELIGGRRGAEGTAQLLVDAALAGGSKDNLTALVVRIDQLPEEMLPETSPEASLSEETQRDALSG